MKILLILSSLLLAPLVTFATPCQLAIENAIHEPGLKHKLESRKFMVVDNENIVEVHSLFVVWSPNSETNSTYHYMVSATCRSDRPQDLNTIENLELYDDMPGEGGVQVKVITKDRY